ncbi:MAG: hypothetical protein Q8P55_02585 [bacterium]|nr:hypothetical protein [bacterium]
MRKIFFVAVLTFVIIFSSLTIVSAHETIENGVAGASGWGMMSTGGFGGFGIILMWLLYLVWLGVGILTAIWLWQNIQKRKK